MALSHIVKAKCSVCDAEIKSQADIFGVIFNNPCGHEYVKPEVETVDVYDFTSTDGKVPRPYQIDGIKFLEQCNFRGLIADEQGLGKTIQGLGAIRLHKDKLLPFVGVTKTTLTHQWYWEIMRWIADEKLTVQVIKTGKEVMMPGFDCYMLSYDMLKNENLRMMLPKGYIKTMVIDECQAIKNHLAGRAKAMQDFSKDIPHIIAMSGTPIKNHAGEYFTILNILYPARFPEYSRFLREHTDHYWGGYGEKVGGLSDPENFRRITKDFIIRRTRDEVAPEIPKVNRQFYHVELDKKLHGAYKQGLQELEDLMYNEDDGNAITSMITIMTKLRKITGLSKTFECVDYVQDFLTDNPTEKIVIFAHHHQAVALLENNLNKWLAANSYGPVLNMNSSLDSQARNNLVIKFRDESAARIMIASTLAAGEGLNLQFCHNAIMLERQWNPANEEQAEGRFARIGQTSDFINVIYMIASETIDEYFTELVEQKRAIVSSTLDGKEIPWDQNSLMKELANTLVTKGKERWRLM